MKRWVRILLCSMFLTVAFQGQTFANAEVAALVEKCKELHKQYDHVAAIQACSSAIAKDSANVDALFYRGFMYQYNNRYAEAIADFTALLRIRQDDADALAWRGRSYQETGQFQVALADLNRVIELYPQYSLVVYIDRASVHQAMGNNELFYKDYQTFMTRQPLTADDYLTLGTFLTGQGKPAEALANLSKAIEMNPASPRGYWSRAAAYYNLKLYQEALKDFDTSITKAPKIAGGYFGRGGMLRMLNRPEEALKDVSKAIEIDAAEASYYIIRSDIYRMLKMPEKMLADLNRAVQIDPQNAFVFFLRGDVLWNSFNRRNEALADLERAHALDPSNSGFVLQLAALHDVMGNTGKAVKYYEVFLATAPTEDQARVTVIGRLGQLKK